MCVCIYRERDFVSLLFTSIVYTSMMIATSENPKNVKTVPVDVIDAFKCTSKALTSKLGMYYNDIGISYSDRSHIKVRKIVDHFRFYMFYAIAFSIV